MCINKVLTKSHRKTIPFDYEIVSKTAAINVDLKLAKTRSIRVNGIPLRNKSEKLKQFTQRNKLMRQTTNLA